MKIRPEHLMIEGNCAAVVPLSMEHHDDLVEAVKDGELYTLRHVPVPEPEHVSAEIKRRLELREKGKMVPFSVVERRSRKIVGLTSFLNMDAEARRIEIGSTWYRRAAQKTAVNTECKFLLLQHAFENLNCRSVEFRTHIMNGPGRKAIERLGANLEGVLCSDDAVANSFVRDTAVYSIFSDEWLTVKNKLLWHLEKPRSAGESEAARATSEAELFFA